MTVLRFKKQGSRTDESDGAEDIDEIFIDCEHVHIEKMADNEYCVIASKGKKQVLLFIGHWPRDDRKQGLLKMNISENTLKSKWHY